MKILYITSLSGKRINGFMRSAIIAAKSCGLDFVMACNMDMADKEGYETDCYEYGIETVHIPFDRNPISIKNIKAYKQLKNLASTRKFDIVHCNTPVGGLLGRLCARKVKIPYVIYQAHGFHFYSGAPILNWIVYYPVEMLLSRLTDNLVTIAKEDYERAKHMKAKQVSFVHGVGIDLKCFLMRNEHDRNTQLREKLNIPNTAKVLLSVGELNKNKNHSVVIKALTRINDDDLFYVICGEGKERKSLQKMIEEKGLKDRVVITGYTSEVNEYYRMADLFVFPSLREGIPAAVMEAIATGIDVLASDIRGIKDIITDKNYRFSPINDEELAKLIENVLKNDNATNRKKNMESITKYSLCNVIEEMKDIYDNARC